MIEKFNELEKKLQAQVDTVKLQLDDGKPPAKHMFMPAETLEVVKNVLELTVATVEIIRLMREWYQATHPTFVSESSESLMPDPCEEE